MTVHAIHIFDRNGKTLFTKRYTKSQQITDAEMLSDQRKLIFGMLFSLRELVGSLTPKGASPGTFDNLVLLCFYCPAVCTKYQSHTPFHVYSIFPALHSVKTGSGTLHCYETISGLRIALYTNTNPIMNTIGARASGADNTLTAFQTSLKHIYSEIWVECVVRSPLYRPQDIQADPLEGRDNNAGRFDIKSTNFEARLDSYLASMPWFR